MMTTMILGFYHVCHHLLAMTEKTTMAEPNHQDLQSLHDIALSYGSY
jgi:hypothetical protein